MNNPSQANTQSLTPQNASFQQEIEPPSEGKVMNSTIFKGPKRKRLVKACDACHKSKRRCDGTAPCSNCYFASKDCTYTDSAGRPVPAPNATRQPQTPAGGQQQQQSPRGGPDTGKFPGADIHGAASSYAPQPQPIGGASDAYQATVRAIVPQGSRATDSFNFTTASSPSSSSPRTPTQPPRKRSRDEREARDHFDSSGGPSQGSYPTGPGPSAGPALEHSFLRTTNTTVAPDAYHGYDRNTIRELVNLFFAHCHPHRLILHSAAFQADLALDRVPSYLLNAVCALAAPLSRRQHIRANPVREAGQKFADAAIAKLFDLEGRLTAKTLEAAQALALLQAYKIYKESHMIGEFKYFDLSFQILRQLRVLSPSPQPVVLTPLPSDELYSRAVQDECARRTFWLIHLIELLGAIFTGRRTTHSTKELSHVRLPCDETTFEMSASSALPEYHDMSQLKKRSTSEFGHLIRVSTILSEIEQNNVPSPNQQAVAACEDRLDQWMLGLGEQLHYNGDNLQMQLSLWETNSNTSTWCFCFLHILRACCVLALSDIRRRIGQAPRRDHQSALSAVPDIMNGVGPRARNSILMGSVLWLQYCGPHAPRIDPVSGDKSRADGKYEGGAEAAVNFMERSPNIPELQKHLVGWIREWEEFWGPMNQHGHTAGINAEMESYRQSEIGPSRDIRDSSSVAFTQQWDVPSVVIDPVLRGEGEQTNVMPRASPTPSSSSTSTLRVRDVPSLPSLKSSGLLDVVTDESLGRASGASTPAKPNTPWSFPAPLSPRPPHPSPGPAVPDGSGISGSSASQGNRAAPPGQLQFSPQMQPQYQMMPQQPSHLMAPGGNYTESYGSMSQYQMPGMHSMRGPSHGNMSPQEHPYSQQSPADIMQQDRVFAAHTLADAGMRR